MNDSQVKGHSLKPSNILKSLTSLFLNSESNKLCIQQAFKLMTGSRLIRNPFASIVRKFQLLLFINFIVTVFFYYCICLHHFDLFW